MVVTMRDAYTLRKVMKRAWEIKRQDSRNIFALCLKMAWAEVREIRFMIADWFMNKNLDKVTTAHCMCFQTFSKEDIVKETEKAFYVALQLMVSATGAESRYTKKVWIPKSVVTTYEVIN